MLHLDAYANYDDGEAYDAQVMAAITIIITSMIVFGHPDCQIE